MFQSHAFIHMGKFGFRFIRKFDFIHFSQLSWADPKKCWELFFWTYLWGKIVSIWFLTSAFCFRTFVAGFLTLTVSAILWKPQENPYPGRGGPPIQPETDPGHDDYQTGGYVDLVGVAGLVPKFSVLPASALESRDSSPVSWVQEEFFCGKRVSYSPITLLDLVESAKRKRKLQRTKQVCHFKKDYWDHMELD